MQFKPGEMVRDKVQMRGYVVGTNAMTGAVYVRWQYGEHSSWTNPEHLTRCEKEATVPTTEGDK